MTKLKNKPEPTVELTTLTVRRVTRKKICVIADNIPLPYITPPKHMAQMMSQIVPIMPPIPLVVTKLFNNSLPVSMELLVVEAMIIAFRDESAELFSTFAI